MSPPFPARRMLGVAASLVLGYAVLVSAMAPQGRRTAVSAHQGNVLRAESFCYTKGPAGIVLVGTSLMERMEPALSGGDYSLLAFGGGDILTGLELVLRSGRPVREVWIEANLPPVRSDVALMDHLFGVPFGTLRGWFPVLRLGNQPMTLLWTRATGGRVVSPPDPPASLEAVGVRRFEVDYSTSPDEGRLREGMQRLQVAVETLRRRGVAVRWIRMPIHPSLEGSRWARSVRETFRSAFPAATNPWMEPEAGESYGTTDGIHLRSAEVLRWWSKVERAWGTGRGTGAARAGMSGAGLDGTGLDRGDGEQALAEGRPEDRSFEAIDPGKDPAVEKPYRAWREVALLSDAERPPPTEVTDGIEVVETFRNEPGAIELLPELREGVTAIVPEVLVDGGVDLGAGGDEEANPAIGGIEEPSPDAEFLGVVFDMFEDIDGDDAVPGRFAGDFGGDGTDEADAGEVGVEAGVELGVGFEAGDFVDAGDRAQFGGKLADPGAHFEDPSPERGSEFATEGGAIISGFAEGGELVVRFEGGEVVDNVHEGDGWVRGILWEQPVFDDAPEGAESVLPIDLLAFGVRPAGVGNGDFEDANAGVGDLGGDFRFKTEAVFLDVDRLDDVTPEHFVAGLHVGETEVGGHVRQQGEQAVPHGMPEVEHPVRPAREAGTEDDIGLPGEEGGEENAVFLRIVFEIGVLDDDIAGGSVADAGAQGRPLAPVLGVAEQFDAGIPGGPGLQGIPGAVRRVVLDNHEFLNGALGQDTFDDGADEMFLIVNRHDDRKARFNAGVQSRLRQGLVVA